MKIFRAITLVFVSLTSSLSVASDEPLMPLTRAEMSPNFIVILIDDLGYGDIGPFGNKANATPNLDRMAREGMTLTSFYVASPVCSPSRAALMTGCYPQRVGLNKGSGHAVLFPGDEHGLHPGEVTIADLLKRMSYKTACVGKWHLGDQKDFLPQMQGFDEYMGIPYSNDMWPKHPKWPFPKLPLMRGTRILTTVDDMTAQGELCKLFTEAATGFIKANAKKPFFLYLSHAFVHAPRNASPDFIAKGKSIEQSQIEELDWSVGQIMDTLRTENLTDHTLVIFTSDNGPAKGLSAGPLRGGKGSAYEGGHRVPTLAWWPGTIPADTRNNELATTMDLFPTFARLAGSGIPRDRVIDGRDISALLKDTKEKSPHARFFYQQNGKVAAVRSGPWKLFTNGKLYNLDQDIGETLDVAASHPEVMKRLGSMLEEFTVDIDEHSRPVGKAKAPRTLTPRPGVKGNEAYTPTLSLGRTQSQIKQQEKKQATNR